MDKTSSNVEYEARVFFGGTTPVPRAFELRVFFEGQHVALNARELLNVASSNALLQSADAHCDVNAYLKREKLMKLMSPWPRLLKLLEASQLIGLRCGTGGWWLPLETLLVSPELLADDEALEIVSSSSVVSSKDAELAESLKLDGEAQRVYHSERTFMPNSPCVLQNAAKQAQRALDIQPDNVVFLVLLGSIQGRMGELAAAIATLKQAHKCNPRFAKAYLRLAQCLQAHKRFAPAVVTLYGGVAHGVFETRLGGKLFQLGRDCARSMTNGRLFSAQNTLQESIDLHVFSLVLIRLPIWDLLTAAQVCTRWNLAVERFIRQYYAAADGIDWKTVVKAKFGW